MNPAFYIKIFVDEGAASGADFYRFFVMQNAPIILNCDKIRIVTKIKKTSKPKIPRALLFSAKVLENMAPDLLVRFLARIFSTPVRHKMPKRELEMFQTAKRSQHFVKGLDKSIEVYRYGPPGPTVLLVHGWSGRGTQLVKIAEALLQAGYHVLSFDAPAHGQSPGQTTLLSEFITCIHDLKKHYGPFESMVGHSLGGLAVLNSLAEGVQVKNAVIIGSGDKIPEVTAEFIAKMRVKKHYVQKLEAYFESKYEGLEMDAFSGWRVAQNIDVPVFVIHDQDDAEVPARAGKHIHQHLKNGRLLLTSGLGHRKILGDKSVIRELTSFIKDET